MRLPDRFRGATLAVLGPSLHVRLRELWTYYRLPLRLRVAPAPSGIPVVLYGIPFIDWTLALAGPALWRQIEGVDEVVRLPGVAWLADLLPRADGRRTVVIPMLPFHTWRPRPGFALLAPGPDALAALDDKAAFAAYMERRGLEPSCPRTYASRGEAEFPLVVKRTDLSAGLGVVVARSPAELDAVLQTDVFRDRHHLLQALTAGAVEYATYGVCHDGSLLWTRTYRTDLGGPDVIKSDDTVRHRDALATPAGVARQIETVLAPLHYSGPCTIDYKSGLISKICIVPSGLVADAAALSRRPAGSAGLPHRPRPLEQSHLMLSSAPLEYLGVN